MFYTMYYASSALFPSHAQIRAAIDNRAPRPVHLSESVCRPS
jgi:hypothetical protein